jgi:Tfp pilus assembly protein PilV
MKNNKGQSLFEVVVAISVITLIIVAMIILTTTSIRNNSYSRNKTVASRYSQEAIEWLRGQRDASWPTFYGKTSTIPRYYCFKVSPLTPTWPSAGLCGDSDYINSNTIFKRQLTLTRDPLNGDFIIADVAVSWTDGQGEHKAESVTYFSDWNK